MGDGNNNKNSGNGGRKKKTEKKTVEEVLNEIYKSISKYSFKEDQIITNGMSVLDVWQIKAIEFLKPNSKPGADPEKDSQNFDYRVDQGTRKLYKYRRIFEPLDEEKFGEIARIQERVEKKEIVQKIFNACSAEHQEVIEFRLWYGFTYEKVAERTGKTKANARKIIHDFKKECRRFGIDSPDQ